MEAQEKLTLIHVHFINSNCCINNLKYLNPDEALNELWEYDTISGAWSYLGGSHLYGNTSMV